MTDTERPTTLAGLVSAEAEEIYQRLCVTGALRAGDVDPRKLGVTELLDLGLAFRSPNDETIRPIEPAVALRILIEARQEEMISFQERILDGWTRLTAMLPSALTEPSNGHHDGVRILTRIEEIVARAAELYPAAKRCLRGTETGAFPIPQAGDRLRVPPAAAVKSGVLFQMIYETDYQSTAAGARRIERSVQAGEFARLRSRLPIKMLHVDDQVALIAADRSGRTALLVRSPAVLELLAEWFDLLWTHPTTMSYPVGGRQSCLSPTQRDVLKLMLTGDDETIARRLALSVTTVRRHIKAIYRALGVNSRFAAGMAAAKLNWL